MPRMTRRSKSDWQSPARAAFLFMITGPSCWWSPTSTACLHPKTSGIIHSGSDAWVASSINTVLNLSLATRGSPAPTQVQQITSAFYKTRENVSICNDFLHNQIISKGNTWRISRSQARFRDLYFLSSAALSSPCSCFSWMSFCNSTLVSLLWTWSWRVKKETGESKASRDLAVTRTTLRPVWWIFSVNWSTATLEGAQTRTWPGFILARWYTMDADVTVLPVPGGPWIKLRGFCRTDLTAYTWEWFSSGRLGTENLKQEHVLVMKNRYVIPFIQRLCSCTYRFGIWVRRTWGSTSWPKSLW